MLMTTMTTILIFLVTGMNNRVQAIPKEFSIEQVAKQLRKPASSQDLSTIHIYPRKYALVSENVPTF